MDKPEDLQMMGQQKVLKLLSLKALIKNIFNFSTYENSHKKY